MKELTLADLNCVVVETGHQPSCSVIWLHGLGADGHDFVPIVPQLTTAQTQAMRFVFPHAPTRPVTINQGMVMRAWYDILGFDVARDQDRSGIDESVAAIQRLVMHEQNAAGIERVVLAGFSQGGAIALRAGLSAPNPLAGIVALSTYLLDAANIDAWLSKVNAQVPLFIGHGQSDPIVPMALGQAAVQTLEGIGIHPKWQAWPMGHEVCMDEVRALDRFFADIFNAKGGLGHPAAEAAS